MESYRLYFMTASGHIEGVDAFLCDNDEEALEISRGKADGRPMELWHLARRVRVFPGGAEEPKHPQTIP